jgi:hypothetical protein
MPPTLEVPALLSHGATVVQEPFVPAGLTCEAYPKSAQSVVARVGKGLAPTKRAGDLVGAGRVSMGPNRRNRDRVEDIGGLDLTGKAAVLKTAGRNPIGVRIPGPPLLRDNELHDSGQPSGWPGFVARCAYCRRFDDLRDQGFHAQRDHAGARRSLDSPPHLIPSFARAAEKAL